MPPNATNTTSKVSYTEKLSRNATVLSTLSMIPIVAQAGVVHVATPLTTSIDDARSFDYAPVDWDVDGDSVADFRLAAFRTIFYTGSGGGSGGYSSYGLSVPNGNLQLQSIGLNGQGVVNDAGGSLANFGNLANGENIGPTLGANREWGVSSINRAVMLSSSYQASTTNGLAIGSNLIGFRFDNSGQTLYGWAELTLDETTLSMTINQWAYDDTGAGIKVGQISSVPVPPSALLMLSGLALGAGGVLRGRKARKELEETIQEEANNT
jgi:hypothetical protein